jgi:hypothetical protein
MSDTASRSNRAVVVFGVLLIFTIIVAVWWFFDDRESWPRGEALASALQPIVDKKSTDQALVARAILENYQETRRNASRWSGLYWGFSWAAAVLSALAGLVLKLESFLKNEGIKKDLAALLSVTAAILVTISTGGDFQRKWQANRIAAAEIERTGYEFLENDGANPRSYLASIGPILLRRHMAIVGGNEQRRAGTEPAKASFSPK